MNEDHDSAALSGSSDGAAGGSVQPATNPRGDDDIIPRPDGITMNRYVSTALSLLVVGLFVQVTAILPQVGRWIVVAVICLVSAIASVAVFVKYKKLPKLEKPPETVPALISSVVTSRRPISLLLAVLLLGGVAGASTAIYLDTRSPTGVIAQPNHNPLKRPIGSYYLFRVNDVQHTAKDLIWFEVTVPLYSSSYAQTYLYYYTQASEQVGSQNSYAAELSISNYGTQKTKDLITALACPGGDTQIRPGSDHANIRKQEGCAELDSACVLLPPCRLSKLCQKGQETFTAPPECAGKGMVGAAVVPPLP